MEKKMKRGPLTFLFLAVIYFTTQLFSVVCQAPSDTSLSNPTTVSLSAEDLSGLEHLRKISKLKDLKQPGGGLTGASCSDCTKYCWACQYCVSGGLCDTTCKHPKAPPACSHCSNCNDCGHCAKDGDCGIWCRVDPPYCPPPHSSTTKCYPTK